jgi:hypothetical protein
MRFLHQTQRRKTMKTSKKIFCCVCIITVSLALLVGSGCETKKQSGALAGAGVGALIGQMAGGSTQATLVGAAVGTGVGYVIGNEMDKKDAKSRQTVEEGETKPLANTTWQVTSIVPKPDRPVKSLVCHFKPDGIVVSTRTFEDGHVETANERYRIVGDTLIINQDNYVVNARFKINGNQMIANTEKHSIVLTRLDT